ncbi:MAG: pyruvate ferredoxin oxidoreductase [Candidatus Pacebacteria bacterium]|nr:pyruvate ferredoxin oxidoreductase [Candidatus Paceibacterota bacterium]
MNIKPLSGAQAGAEALRQIGIEVFPVYPITPQSPIAEGFAKIVANGDSDAELINVESEHSAMSAAVGAAAAGVKTATATSSQGLALMSEIVYVASGLRLPILMPVANRALSAPINIHCDHSDTMMVRDSGWIQIYAESAQEFYENLILAFKVAKNENVLLPAMVMIDGFITTHQIERVKLFEDSVIKNFLGSYKPPYNLLDIKNPTLVGPFSMPDSYFEFKISQEEAMENAREILVKEGEELKKITGNSYNYFEKYQLDDAEYAIVVMSSTAGTAKAQIDKLRKKGEKVGLLKPRIFRPFPYEEIKKALTGKKAIAVLDRSLSFGANPPLYAEIKQALGNKIPMQKYVFGLGGRNIYDKDIKKVFKELKEGKVDNKIKWIK